MVGLVIALGAGLLAHYGNLPAAVGDFTGGFIVGGYGAPSGCSYPVEAEPSKWMALLSGVVGLLLVSVFNWALYIMSSSARPLSPVP
jgi:hypothetical protein